MNTVCKIVKKTNDTFKNKRPLRDGGKHTEYM